MKELVIYTPFTKRSPGFCIPNKEFRIVLLAQTLLKIGEFCLGGLIIIHAIPLAGTTSSLSVAVGVLLGTCFAIKNHKQHFANAITAIRLHTYQQLKYSNNVKFITTTIQVVFIGAIATLLLLTAQKHMLLANMVTVLMVNSLVDQTIRMVFALIIYVTQNELIGKNKSSEIFLNRLE